MVIIGETFKLEIRTLADLSEEIFSLRDEPDVICIIRQNLFDVITNGVPPTLSQHKTESENTLDIFNKEL